MNLSSLTNAERDSFEAWLCDRTNAARQCLASSRSQWEAARGEHVGKVELSRDAPRPDGTLAARQALVSTELATYHAASRHLKATLADLKLMTSPASELPEHADRRAELLAEWRTTLPVERKPFQSAGTVEKKKAQA